MSYIGICGVQNVVDAHSIIRLLRKYNKESVGGIGYIYDPKNIHHRCINAIDLIQAITDNQDSSALHIIHYSCSADSNLSTDCKTLLENVITTRARIALQVNNFLMITPEEINKLHAQFPRVQIVIAVPVIECEYKDVVSFFKRLHFIPHALFDFSCGQGKSIDLVFFSLIKKILRDTLVESYGFAGGLNHKDIQKNNKVLFLAGFNHFSVDAESGLRNSLNQLDLAKVEQYIQKCSIE